MSKKITKENVIQNKKNSIRTLNALLEKYINSNDEKLLKKADLLSYWINSFATYIDYETAFNPKKLLSYKRGDIIRVNFGFRVGAEFGGLHYAVVLDKNSHHNSNTITVIPLTSFKPEKEIYDRDLFLGTELYNLVVSKFNTQYNLIHNKCSEIKSLADVLKDIPASSLTPEISSMIQNLNQQIIALNQSLDSLLRDKVEIDRMKMGSIAKIEQITTISKMRIYTPKKSADFLSGVHFSQNAMSRINSKIKELYIFDE